MVLIRWTAGASPSDRSDHASPPPDQRSSPTSSSSQSSPSFKRRASQRPDGPKLPRRLRPRTAPWGIRRHPDGPPRRSTLNAGPFLPARRASTATRAGANGSHAALAIRTGRTGTTSSRRFRTVASAPTSPTLLLSEPAGSKRKLRTTPATSSRRLGFRGSGSLPGVPLVARCIVLRAGRGAKAESRAMQHER